ncbi:MAG: ferritin-like domain-containing protein, partial [Alphaproteobacteria bacterium]|nr:ferritin-like domain-containing protein [Alphaproteobacteria bacterium]
MMTGARAERARLEALSRRGLIGAGAAGMALSAALPILSGCTTAAIGAHEAVRPGDDGALLSDALSLEYEAVAAYDAVLEASLLSGDDRDLAMQFCADHTKHAEVIARAIEGRRGIPVAAPPPSSYRFATTALGGGNDALRFLLGFEEGLA